MENTKNQRLKEFINYLKSQRIVYNDTEFSGRLNKPKSYLSGILNEKRPITDKFVQQIVDSFPNLNREWLLFGEGEMLKNSTISQSIEGNSNNLTNSGNILGVSTELHKIALEEISQQRKLTQKAQEQIDRLLTLLENTQK